MRNVVNGRGHVGCVLPTGIATDDTTKFFFQDVVGAKSLVSLFDFENKGVFFPSPSLPCAVRRRRSSAGANPVRQLSLQPVAVGADDGGNKIVLKHSDAKGSPWVTQRPCGPQRE